MNMNTKELRAAIKAMDAEAKISRTPKAELEAIYAKLIAQLNTVVETKAVEQELTDAQKRQARFEKARKSQAASMSITNRAVVNLSTMHAYDNANRAYKQGALTAAQGDRVTKKLLTAHLNGEVGTKVEVQGQEWMLYIDLTDSEHNGDDFLWVDYDEEGEE